MKQINVAEIDVSGFQIDELCKMIVCGLNLEQIKTLWNNHHFTFDGTNLRFSGFDEETDMAEYTYDDEEGQATKFLMFIGTGGTLEMYVDEEQA